MTIEQIKIIAAIFSIVGSGILAVRVTGILSALSLIAKVHEINIQQLMPDNQTSDVYNLDNSTEHIEKAQKKGFLITGFVCSVLSGVLQLIALLKSSA